uniref:leucine-rich repeat domain-containing protein n=1 Tax=Methyloglobulus sp. TaxID=2518622 RepID=UPI00398A2176
PPIHLAVFATRLLPAFWTIHRNLPVHVNDPKLIQYLYIISNASFLNNALTQRFPEPAEREALFKVLLECVDLNRNQRIAEGKSVAELAASSPGLPAEHLQYALDYFASGQMRILEKLTVDPPRYRLPHETLIPALRQLGGKILSAVAEAEFLLQTAYATWQNSGNNRRYLLSGKELKKVRQFQQQLDLRDRGVYLQRSKQQKLKMLGIVIAVMALVPIFAYYSYQSYLDNKYHSALMDWGLPGDIMDYTGQLQLLSISDKDVRYLDWLADFKKLTTLTLDLRDINSADLSDLRELKQLTTVALYLGNSNITDLSALPELKQLTTLTLDLSDSNITDLSVLPELKQLTTLTLVLRDPKITDLSILPELKQLTTVALYLGNSNITDLSTLPELKQLTTLTLALGNSKTTDLSPLTELKQLTTLTLALKGPRITDLSTITSLKARQITLDIQDSKINNIKSLPNLTRLKMGNIYSL